MTQAWPAKAPTDVFNWTIDWAEGLTDPVTNSVATVDGASGVTIDSQTFDGTSSTVVLSGGTPGALATITFANTLTSGYSYSRGMQVLVSDSVSALAPTTTKKRALVAMAFEEIGLAGYEFDATLEEYSSALRRLDGLTAELKGQGIDLGYNTPATFGGGDLDDYSGIPDASVNVVIMRLAMRIMPAIGKTMSAETRVALAEGMNVLRANYAVIPTSVLPRNTVRGAGSRWVTSPFTTRQ